MEKKIKIGLTFLIICVILVSLLVLYLNRSDQRIKPPDTLHVEIIVDLKSPDEGTIHITCPENKVSTDDYDVVVGANRNAWEILDQYSIPYKNPNSIKPLREGGKVTASLDFFVDNKYEFAWPVCTFKSTWSQMWMGADFTVILPEDYEIVNITTRNVVEGPTKTFEDERWRITTKTLDNSEFHIEITYEKIENQEDLE